MLHPHWTRVACATAASLAYAEAQQSRSALPGVYPITSECTTASKSADGQQTFGPFPETQTPSQRGHTALVKPLLNTLTGCKRSA